MRFRSFLTEGRQKPDWFLKDKAAIERLLDADYVNNSVWFKVNNMNRIVPVSSGSMKLLMSEKNMIERGGKYYFGFEIQSVSTFLEIDVDGDIGSLLGLPDTFGQTIYLSARSVVFDHLPKMERGLALAYNEKLGMKSLTGIHKAKTSMDYVTIGDTVVESILGLVIFDYKTRIMPIKPSHESNNKLFEATQTMSTHIAENNHQGDLIECKELLIAKGLKDYAKL